MADEEDVQALKRGDRDMARRDLRNGTFSSLDLSGCDFSNAHLEHSDFSAADLSGSKLQKAKTLGMKAEGAILQSVHAESTVFHSVNFRGANLRGAKLSRSHFTKVDFTGADISDADFTHAVINDGCDFSNCVVNDRTRFDQASIIRPLARQDAFKGYIVERGVLRRKPEEGDGDLEQGNEVVFPVEVPARSTFEEGMSPAVFSRRPTMKQFIVHVLESKARPLSIDEIAQGFSNAGHRYSRDSIRGRLNSLTSDGKIRRVGRGMYASANNEDRGAIRDAQPGDLPPVVPDQEYGISFGISKSGKISFISAGKLGPDDDVRQVETMRAVILNAIDDLLEATRGSNAFVDVHRLASNYKRALTGEILTISIDRLFAEGVRLDNANFRLKREIDSGDLPDMGLRVGEALDSVLAIHGPTILSTQRGQELLERSRQYNATREEELEYKARARSFARLVAKSKDLVEPEVQVALEPLNQEIGEGRFPERSSSVAHQANRNLLSIIAKVSLISSPLIAESITASIPGGHIVSAGASLIDAAYGFLLSHQMDLRLLASVAGAELSWLSSFLDWLVRRARS